MGCFFVRPRRTKNTTLHFIVKIHNFNSLQGIDRDLDFGMSGFLIFEQWLPFLIILLGLSLMAAAVWGILIYFKQGSPSGREQTARHQRKILKKQDDKEPS